MRHNRVRASLDADQPALGTRILSSWPTVLELIGQCGRFDYVELCAEYVPYDHATLNNMRRAIELFNHLGGMIKIEQESREHTAVRGIGAGFQSVLSAVPGVDMVQFGPADYSNSIGMTGQFTHRQRIRSCRVGCQNHVV